MPGDCLLPLDLPVADRPTSTSCIRTATAPRCAAGRYRARPVKTVTGDWDNQAEENIIGPVTLAYDFFELAQ